MTWRPTEDRALGNLSSDADEVPEREPLRCYACGCITDDYEEIKDGYLVYCWRCFRCWSVSVARFNLRAGVVRNGVEHDLRRA